MQPQGGTTRRDALVGLAAGATASLIPWGEAAPAEGAGPRKVLAVNPYAGIDWRRVGQHKAALHLHTQQSDGYQPVAEVVQAYRRAGFTVLSITDHDWNRPNARVAWKEIPPEKGSPYPREPHPKNYPANPTWPWPDYGCASPEKLDIVGIQGNELTFLHHINSYFSDYGVWYERTGSGAPYGGIVDAQGTKVTEDDQIQAIRDAKGLAVINHPGIPNKHAWWDRKPLDWYVARYRKHSPECLVGIEVSNCGVEVSPYDEGLWDQLLARSMPQRPIWGFGTDDMHNLAAARQSFSVFFLAAPTAANVREAMLTGRSCTCVSTKGINYQDDPAGVSVFPKLKGVAVDQAAGTITVHADHCDEVRWLGAPESLEPVADYKTSNQPWPLGRVVHVGETVNYQQNAGIGTYVRAELHRREGKHTHRTLLNPFGFGRA
ncbi:MAG: hypothetical protein HN849_33550 [Victivallales bacterium]|nr:hypothetical protein [Victivallales bacterium]